jgi:DNA-binding NarL/FixJ family response regulator
MESAIAAVVQFTPDVVLADVHMPDSTPVELCTRIRAAAGTRSLRLLLFSGMSDEALAELVHATGADGFVSKERGVNALIEKVTSAYRSISR